MTHARCGLLRFQEEAQEFIGEAEDLKMEADALEREAESIVEGADEYERMEAVTPPEAPQRFLFSGVAPAM